MLLRKFIVLLFSILIAAPAMATDELPLRRGYYVLKGTPCNQASNFSTYLLTRDSLRAGPEICQFRKFEHEDEGVYIVTEKCDGQKEGLYGWVTGVDNKSFSRTAPGTGPGPGEETRARYCPQRSMPEPWRSNDIRALIK